MNNKNQKQMATVRECGRQAALEGIARHACPYADLRTRWGAVTFSRNFRQTWLDGYDSVSR